MKKYTLHTITTGFFPSQTKPILIKLYGGILRVSLPLPRETLSKYFIREFSSGDEDGTGG